MVLRQFCYQLIKEQLGKCKNYSLKLKNSGKVTFLLKSNHINQDLFAGMI